MNRKLKVLQITPHLGGGLGRVLINWVRSDKDNYHILACLEKTTNATESFEDLKDKVYEDVYKNKELLEQLIFDSDIVVVNWYNHPLLFDLMINWDWPECRLICYNHVNSLYPPYNMSDSLIEFFDKIVFTTEASYEAQEIINLNSSLFYKLECIESAFGIENSNYVNFKKEKQMKAFPSFNVGYTGTASYAKLHPDFIKMCSMVNVPNVKFIICSGDSQQHLKDDAKKLNILNKFSFEGRVESVIPYLAKFDVFGYPLQPKHLGSAEQAIGEAMICGVVPVLMNNKAESYIIKNLHDGILANNEEEYSDAIGFLYRNKELREKMSKNAIQTAKEKYSINRKINKWDVVFDEVLNINKYKHKWESVVFCSYEGTNTFIQSLGTNGIWFYLYIKSKEKQEKESVVFYKNKIKDLYMSNYLQFSSESKGGPKQYLKSFPNDFYLREFVSILEECK